MIDFTGKDAETAIGEAIGYASMCWDPSPTGEFESDLAGQLADALVAHLRELRLLPRPEEQPAVCDGKAVAHYWKWDGEAHVLVCGRCGTTGDEAAAARLGLGLGLS